MADNVVINTGTGPTIVTDQIGTAHYQVIKIALGSADTASMLPVGQQTMAASLPVVIASNQSTVPVSVVAFTPSGTQDVALVSGTVSTVLAMPVLSATGVTVASVATIATGTVSVVAMPVLSASNVTVASIAAGTISTVLAMPVLSATNITVASITAGTISTVLAMPVLSATGVTIASVATIATGTFTVAGTPVVTATISNNPLVCTAANVTIASVTTGTMTVANILQYTANSTVMNATAQGMVMMGMQSGATTGRSVVVTTTGGLVIGAMPSVGGGQQYTDGTVVDNTGTGTLLFGVSNNTARSLLIHTTGGLIIQSMPAVGGGQQYSAGNTDMGATATGPLILGLQSGATTGRAIVVTTTGAITSFVQAGTLTTVLAMPVLSATNITVASITAGTISTVLAMPVLSATGVTIASVATIATGTVSVINTPVVTATISNNPLVCTAANITVASITTGTMNVINVLSATGVTLAATTASIGAVVCTAHSSRWNAYAVNTDSGAVVILKTSGAHTLYVTDLMVSVDTAGSFTLFSAATTKLTAYFATRGGMVMNMQTPMVMNSAQSVTFILSVSGSCAAYAAGYTVT